MDFILEGLISILTNAVYTFADTVGTGVLGLLTINIGQDASVFNIVFNSIDSIISIMNLMALSLLALILIWNITAIMLSPNASESPSSLIISTFAAGVAVSFAPDLVLIVENIFCEFYTAILDIDTSSQFSSFHNVWARLSNAFDGNGGSQLNIGTQLLIFLLICLITYEFVMFLIEVVERYLVLGVLYMTSPLAAAMFGSKSTRPIFSAWMRMIMSQMFLMVCNVLFFKMFLMAASGFEDNLLQASSTINQQSMAIVWCLIIYGILNIATRMDSYLGTLGLNTAQTGRGLGASLTSTLFGMKNMLTMAKAGAKLGIGAGVAAAGTAGKMANWAKNTTVGQKIANSSAAKGVQDAMRYGKEKGVDSTVRATRDKLNIGNDLKKDSYGRASAASITDAFDGNLRKSTGGESINGKLGGDGFIASATDIHKDKRAMLDAKTFQMHDNGTATIQGRSASGKSFTMTASSVEALKSNGQDVTKLGGERFTLRDENGTPILDKDGKERQFIATATGAGAKEFMSYNPAAEAHKAEFASKPNCSVENVPNIPGAWIQKTVDPNTQKVSSAQMYTPTSIYQGDLAMNSRQTDKPIGNQRYHVTDVTALANGETRAPIEFPSANNSNIPSPPSNHSGAAAHSAPPAERVAFSDHTLPTRNSTTSSSGATAEEHSGDTAQPSQAAMVKQMQTAFPTLANSSRMQITDISTAAGDSAFGQSDQRASSGIYTFQNSADGTKYALAPAAEYGITVQGAKNAQTITASNGAPYVQVPITADTDLSKMFFKRDVAAMPKSSIAPDFNNMVAPAYSHQFMNDAKRQVAKRTANTAPHHSGKRGKKK